jgi:dipeptidyl-peptidase-3
LEKFADIQILHYAVPHFERLSLQQKKLIYFLSEAALWGRDILFDQNGKYNLRIRRTLEAIYSNYQGDRNSADFEALQTYLKRVWFSSGIHHHYGCEKFIPEFSPAFLKQAMLSINPSLLPLESSQSAEDLFNVLEPVIFDPKVMPQRVNKKDGYDLLTTSACNYYDNVTQEEAESFYNRMKIAGDDKPISYGLNSKLVKENGRLIEKVWKVNGLYTQAIEKNRLLVKESFRRVRK